MWQWVTVLSISDSLQTLPYRASTDLQFAHVNHLQFFKVKSKLKMAGPCIVQGQLLESWAGWGGHTQDFGTAASSRSISKSLGCACSFLEGSCGKSEVRPKRSQREELVRKPPQTTNCQWRGQLRNSVFPFEFFHLSCTPSIYIFYFIRRIKSSLRKFKRLAKGMGEQEQDEQVSNIRIQVPVSFGAG